MTELELIIDLHKNSERLGPGSERETLKALDFISPPKDRILKIADIGCGSGGQTITLAQQLNGQITAVDLFSEFLEELNKKSKKLGLTDKIITLAKSMDDLPFKSQELDIIWSEGAIYNIGFENGVKIWKEYLKSGGYLAVSEMTWLTTSRPIEINKFWMQEYPEIDTASAKIKVLEENDLTLEGYFNISQQSWLNNYYKPLEEKFEEFLIRNKNSELANKVVEDYKAEIDLYKKFSNHYGYGFYIARKN